MGASRIARRAIDSARKRVASTAFLWHNYGKSTIGSRADIERVPATTLRRFYAKYYQPDNATLVVAGKFDEARAIHDIEILLQCLNFDTGLRRVRFSQSHMGEFR